jgi:O-acetyl-ADP-ribose deacetylase (regulator of RNase III)
MWMTIVSTPDDSSRTVVRMGFVVDIVGYGDRTATAKVDAQHRLAALVSDVLHELGLDLNSTANHGTGDGIMVFLPTTTEVHRALPRLVRATADVLAVDNNRYRDRLRLRMAAVVGPLGPAAIGFAGQTIVEAARLVDSQVLREALAKHQDADLAVLVSEPLYAYVVGERHPGLDPADFRPVEIRAKNYQNRAWLWVGGRVASQPQATATRQAEMPIFELARPYRSACALGIISGDIRRVRQIDVWVNSENTHMEMARINEFSISGIIRYLGARRDAAGRVAADLIADELGDRVGKRRPVAPCSVFVTGAGALSATNNVRFVIHVAAVHGEPGEGFRQVRDIRACATNALTEAERLAAVHATVRTLLVPLLGVGVAGASIEATADALVDSVVDYLIERPQTRLRGVYLLGYTESERAALVTALTNHRHLRLSAST